MREHGFWRTTETSAPHGRLSKVRPLPLRTFLRLSSPAPASDKLQDLDSRLMKGS